MNNESNNIKLLGLLNTHFLQGTKVIPKVHVRPARPDDYEGVMAIIPDLWGAVDYMPVMYHTYFSDPCAHPYVGVVEGKVVSILRAHVSHI